MSDQEDPKANAKVIIKPFSIWFVVPRCLGLFAIILPLFATLRMPELMQNSDYLTAFYVAGRTVLQGTPGQLYPSPADTAFFTTAFNTLAHQVLPHMPAASTAIYMYPPLVALLFAPFSVMPPEWSMLAWQVTSVLAVAASAWLVAALTDKKNMSFFWFAFLFLPVFQTLLIGHLGLVCGLLPLLAGFYLLMRGRHAAAGCVWALLLLKPQFLPAVLLVSGALALERRWQCAAGLIGGASLVSVITVLCLGPDTFAAWLQSFRLSDTIFSNPAYHYPKYLVTCLPGLIVQSVPSSLTKIAKLASYGLAAFVGLHALWISVRLLRSTKSELALPFVFLLGLFVLPLVLPHFLFYDLCCFAAAGMIAFGFTWPHRVGFILRTTCILAWIVLDLYDLMFMSPLFRFTNPGVVVAVLVLLYVRLVFLAGQIPAIEKDEANATILPDPGHCL